MVLIQISLTLEEHEIIQLNHILDSSKSVWERERDKGMDLEILWTWVKYHHLWLAIKQTKRTIVTNGSIGSQRPRTKYFSNEANFLHMLVGFSKNISYVKECMHPLQMNTFQVYLTHTFILETQRRVKAKVSTKYLERHTQIHLKQLHARMAH
jgi:hypothetical protein